MWNKTSYFIVLLYMFISVGCSVQRHTTSTHSETNDSVRIEHIYIRDTIYIEKVVERGQSTTTDEARDITTETHEYNTEGVLIRYIKTTDKSQIKTIDSLYSIIREQEERLVTYQRSDTTENITSEEVFIDEEKKTSSASLIMVIVLIIVAIIGLYKILR